MADRLTQLQDCLDQLLTQFYASIRYINTHHPSSPISTQPIHTTAPSPPPTTNGAPPQDPTTGPSSTLQPPATPSQAPPDFPAAIKELAHDLVQKQKQIEYLISVLPGLNHNQEQQEERIRVLEGELRVLEVKKETVRAERDELVGRLEGVIAGARRW